MASLEPPGLGDRPKWILRLLYAPAEGKSAMPIVGMTRLMKGCFLIHKRLESDLGVETDFEFRPDQYGPLDEKVYDAVEFLQAREFIERTESDKYDGEEFRLTDRGIQEARRLYKDLPYEQRQLISWVKSRHVLKPLPKLLSFVYNEYPETTKESELT